MKTIRIFISSPGDVAEERDRARQVVLSLRKRYAGRLELKPVLWEDLPLQADMSFQEGIDLVLSGEQGIDIAIFILWSRLGSPLGATILRPDGSDYRSGTEREFDLMLEARRQSGEDRPKFLVYTREDESSFEERLRGRPTAEKEDLIQQKKLVEQFIREEFHTEEGGHNVRAYHSFDRPTTFTRRLETHLQELLDGFAGGDTGSVIWDVEKQGAPFKGLCAFGEADAAVFCGRDLEVLEARQRLREQARRGRAWLILSGASGSGKSSLARAGIAPMILRQELDETVSEWRSLMLTPTELGIDPIDGLLRSLSAQGVLPELRNHAEDFPQLSRDLRTDPERTFRYGLRPVLCKTGEKAQVRILIVLDQMEEAFGAANWSMETRHAFFNLLDVFARSGRIWVLGTVRSDFFAQVQEEPVLTEVIGHSGLYTVCAPEADRLRRIIEEPALLAGLQYEEQDGMRLSERILTDAVRHEDLLPLLEYVLLELFERRNAEGVLTWSAYESLGGVEGALAKRAEEVFIKLSHSVQATLGQVLNELVTVGDAEHGAENTSERVMRQRAPLARFPKHSQERELVDALVCGRLLTVGGNEDSIPTEATVTVAHEALLRAWPRAHKWAEMNREFLRVRSRVASRMHEGSPLLAGDPLLEVATRFLTTHRDGFTETQVDWLEQCTLRVEQEKQKRDRLRRGVLVGLSILTLASVCGAIGSFVQWRNAANQRDNAQTARQAANELISFMQYDLSQEIEKIGRLSVMRGINARIRDYYRLYPPEEANLEGIREASQALIQTGDILLDLGDTSGAIEAFDQALTIRQRLAENNPMRYDFQHDFAIVLTRIAKAQKARGDYVAADRILEEAIETQRAALLQSNAPDRQLDLSQSLQELGDIRRALGFLQGAEAAYTEAIAIARSLIDHEDNRADWMRNLAISLNKHGDLERERGAFDRADSVYQEALEISRHLADTHPHDVILVRQPTYTLDRMGDLRMQQGDWSGAYEFFIEAYHLDRQLVTSDPLNTHWQRGLAIGLAKRGAVYVGRGNLIDAEAALVESLDIFQHIHALDNNNATWQRDLSVAFVEIGDILRMRGDLSAAMAAYQKSLILRQQLSESDPSHPGWKREMALALGRIGGIQQAQGDLVEALAAHQEAHAIFRALSESDPTHTGWKRDMALALGRIGSIQQAQGELAEALAAHQEAHTIFRALSESNPSHPEWIRDVAIALSGIGSIRQAQGDLLNALAAYEEALAIRRGLSASNPEHADWKRDVAITLGRIGTIRQSLDDFSGALAAYEEELALLRTLSNFNLEHPGWQGDVAIALVRIGRHLQSRGNLAGALAAQEEALVIRRALAQAQPSNLGWQSNLANSLEAIGSQKRRSGDLLGAQSAYEEALAIRRALHQSHPSHQQLLSALSITLEHYGNLQYNRMYLNEALEYYSEALEISRLLHETNPLHQQWKHDVAYGILKIGDVKEQMGDLQGAFVAYQEASTLFQELVLSEPDHAAWKSDLAISLMGAGDILRKMNELERAYEQYQAAWDLKNELLQNSDNPQRLRGMSIVLQRIGMIYEERGDIAQALDTYQEALQILHTLLILEPDEPDWRRGVFVNSQRVGDLLRLLDDAEGAEAAYLRSLQSIQSLSESNPLHPDWRDRLANAHVRLWRLYKETGRPDIALDHLLIVQDILQGTQEFFGPSQRTEESLLWVREEIAILTESLP